MSDGIDLPTTHHRGVLRQMADADRQNLETARATRRAPRPAISSTFGLSRLDYSMVPFTVIWEVTRACDLRCIHCRADAQPGRYAGELTTEEGYRLLEQVRDLAPPVFVLTGGDPLKRADLFDLIRYAVDLGLSVAVTPSGTPLLTLAAVARMRDLGVKRMALSLDGADAQSHDGFRGQPGSFDFTMRGLEYARARGLPVQINTTVTRRNLPRLADIAAVVEAQGAAVWSAFFLVTVGRAGQRDQLDAAEFEDVFGFLHDLSRRVSFGVRTTAAPHYRRYLRQQRSAPAGGVPPGTPFVADPAADLPRAPRGVTDGSGIAFVSHTGDVYPSGFLPIPGGNVRRSSLADIYRHSPLFTRLRDPDALGGKCGQCEFRRICAGSRARAFARTGDPLAEDPACAYQPRSKKRLCAAS
jgi:AdoMet-dependent heme synthase